MDPELIGRESRRLADLIIATARRALLEDKAGGGFTGVVKDSRGRSYHYVNGRRVAGPPSASHADNRNADSRAGAGPHKPNVPTDPNPLKKFGAPGRIARMGMLKAKELWRKLPKRPRRAVAKAFHGLEMAMHASKQIAFEVAKARGASVDNARRLAKTLGAIDTTLSWVANVPVAHTLLHNLGAGEAISLVGSKIGGVMPTASLAYIAYSGVRNPLKTMRAAWKVLSGHSHGMSEQVLLFEDARDIADDLLDRIEDAEGGADWYLALFHAAMDATRDPHAAMDLADEAFERVPAEPGADETTEGLLEERRRREEGEVWQDRKGRWKTKKNGVIVGTAAPGGRPAGANPDADRRVQQEGKNDTYKRRMAARVNGADDSPRTAAATIRTAFREGRRAGADLPSVNEAAAAALLGTRLQSHGNHGFDTAGEFGDVPLMVDAKSSKKAGYADKLGHKIAKYKEWQAKGGIPAYLVVSEGHGVYLHVGIDPASSPGIGGKRPVVRPGELARHVDGTGGPVPFVKVSDAWQSVSDIGNATPRQIADLRRNVHKTLEGLDMKKVQQHVQKQLDEYNEKTAKEFVDFAPKAVGGAVTPDNVGLVADGMSDTAAEAMLKALQSRKSKPAA